MDVEFCSSEYPMLVAGHILTWVGEGGPPPRVPFHQHIDYLLYADKKKEGNMPTTVYYMKNVY